MEEFHDFLEDVDRELLHHPIVVDNAYTRWFQDGLASDDELRYFRPAVLRSSPNQSPGRRKLLRVLNAPTLQQARSAKEILMNELGVIYRRTTQGNGAGAGAAAALSEVAKDREGDPELVSTEGTVDGGVFRFRAAHFEWLLAVAEGVGLTFDDIGRREHGRPATLHFCDELRRLYGSEDGQVAAGASFAVENWAAAGFWQELEDGLMHIKQSRHPQLRLAFFTWHNRVEAQHAGHTMEELGGRSTSIPTSTATSSSGEATKSSRPSPRSGTASKTIAVRRATKSTGHKAPSPRPSPGGRGRKTGPLSLRERGVG